MSLATRAGDLFYSFRFVKLLTTPWEETDAFKLGIIDENGKRDKSKRLSTSEEKAAYSSFVRLVFNIKRMLEKLPGGSRTLSSYAAALYLIKEKYNLSDKSLDKIMKTCDIDPLDLMQEHSLWFIVENDMIAPGVYRVRNDKLVNSTADELVRAKDQIRINENCYPVGEVAGLPIYEATHIKTRQTIYITVGEIYK